MFYEVSVNFVGFGVVREFSALPSILVFLAFKLMNASCFRRFCLQTPSVAVFTEGQASKSQTGDSVCKGSGVQEPDSPRKSMALGRDERPRAKNHGFYSPCTKFEYFCKSETSCFTTFKEFPMAKVSCF